MISLHKELSELLSHNVFLLYGLSRGIVNLTQLARLIKPHLEVRTKKEIEIATITMQLSRLSKVFQKTTVTNGQFVLNTVTAQNHICILSVHRTDTTVRSCVLLQQELLLQRAYFSMSQGLREITMMFEASYLDRAKSLFVEVPLSEQRDVTALTVTFSPEYTMYNGLIFVLSEQLQLQNINIIEMNSTFTELTFYVHERDAKRAFDALFETFQVGDVVI